MAWSVRTCRLRRPSAVELTRLALGFCVITTMCVFLSGSKSMMDSVIQEVKAAGAKGNPKINLLSDTNLLSDKLKEQFAEEGIKGNQIDQLSGRLNQDQEMELAVGNVDTPHPHTNLHPDDLTLIDIHPFTIEINQDICNVSDIALVTIIHSAVKNNDARRIIRDTWGNPKIPGVNTRLVFLVGQSDEPDKEAELKEEAYQFNDIVQGGFHDSYRNLSYKSIFGKLWVSEFCEQAEFVVKTDDDMFIDLYATYHITRQYLEHPKYLGNEFILCPKWYGMGIIRDPESKSYVSYEEISKEEAPTNGFPTYCTGWIYILNPGTARRLTEVAAITKFMWIDDAWVTGILAEKLAIEHIDLIEFFVMEMERIILSKSVQNPEIYHKDYLAAPNARNFEISYALQAHAEWCYRNHCFNNMYRSKENLSDTEMIVDKLLDKYELVEKSKG